MDKAPKNGGERAALTLKAKEERNYYRMDERWKWGAGERNERYCHDLWA
jgi:hypothetical protein